MGDFRPESLFICHSHKDKAVVRPIVEMQPDIKEAAYIDYSSTPLGESWKEEHENAIKNANRLILAWSRNSAQSAEVEREWKVALAYNTTIIPVFLDETPLPSELKHLHGLSLSEYVSGRNTESLSYSIARGWFGLDAVPSIIIGTLNILFYVFIMYIGVYWAWIGNDGILKYLISIISALVLGTLVIASIQSLSEQIRRFKLQQYLARLVIENLKKWKQ